MGNLKAGKCDCRCCLKITQPRNWTMGKLATKCLLLIVLLLAPADRSTVYSANELFLSSGDDRIHSKIDSAYNLKDYGDVFELLDQETRVKDLKKKEETLEILRSRLDSLMTKDDEEVDVEQSILRSDKDCLRVGDLYKKLNLFESVVLSLEAKGFRTRDFIRTSNTKATKGASTFPECSQQVQDDSIAEFIFQSKGFRNRRSLTASAELEMIPEVAAGLTANDYGGAVADALKTNTTSWVLLNMATFYHRMVGNAQAGLECSRRAFHFSPPKHKDMALASIASLLFRGDCPEDALMALRTAIDVSGGSTAVYSLMGFILASTSEFDAAVDAFANALKFDKQNTKLNEYRYAVRCHAKVHRALSEQHQDLREIIRQFDKMGILTKSIDAAWAAVHSVRRNNVQVLLHAFSRRSEQTPRSFRSDGSYDFAFSLEDRRPLSWLNGETLHFATRPPRFAKLLPDMEDEFIGSGWPTAEDCELRLTRDIASYRPMTVAIPWENKGFQFWSVVGRLAVTEAFPLPFCESVPFKLPSTTSEMFGSHGSSNATSLHPDAGAQKIILDYMGVCGSVDQFGRKIMLAHILNIIPSWMFYDLAGLYWRAVGATSRTAQCYGRAFHDIPTEYRDVVDVGMASFFRFLNMSDASLFIMGELAESKTREPAILYTIGTILNFHGFLSLAIRNYKFALLSDVSYFPAWDAFRNSRCMQQFLAPGQTKVSPQMEKYLGLRNGVVEIGIGILQMDVEDMHLLKKSIDDVFREDILHPAYADRLRIALNDFKKVGKKKKS